MNPINNKRHVDVAFDTGWPGQQGLEAALRERTRRSKTTLWLKKWERRIHTSRLV